MISTYLISAALGISLAACCGFRIFIPLLMASVAGKFGWLPLSNGFEWMGTLPAMIAFALASVLEVAAYYIPVVDNFLDALTTPSSVVAGTVIAASAFVDFDPMLKWTLAIIAGGGTAGIIQAGTGLLRLGSTKFTAGIGNALVSTAENIFSLLGSVLAVFIPVIMLVLVAATVAGLTYLLIQKTKKAVS
jgi:hypothetical protein